MSSLDESLGLLHLNAESFSRDESRLDIVAVHGVGGDRLRSWTYNDSLNDGDRPCWLRDFLPIDTERTNLYTYGYLTGTSMESTAQDLIRTLDNERMSRHSFDIPIAFVAYNTGGLIVKQALILLASFRERSQSRILTNTVSLLFFAVPHRSSYSAYLGQLWRLLRFFSREKFGGENFLPSERELRMLVQGFAPISNRFRIYTFCDSIPMPNARYLGMGGIMNYYMGLPNEELLHINANFINMVRFPSRENTDYRKVLAILRRTAFQDGAGVTPHSNNWRADQLFRLDGLESETGKQWFVGLGSDAHRVVESRSYVRGGRVAVVDSGIDWDHPNFQESISEDRIITKSFVDGLDENEDIDGHGTHTAHLVLKVAPNAKLFIARVYEHGTEEEIGKNVEAIAQAIHWAREQQVHIISISLGYRSEIEPIKVALRDAFHSSIIIFAAASNSGVNPRNPISFPANMRQVICIHSSDGDGNPSPYNPPATPDCNFAILGERVAAAWPRNLQNDRSDNLRVASGSSVATPIAAGLAALILEYAAQGGPTSEVVSSWNRLKHCDEIRKLFRSIARDRDGYKSIAPSILFDYHGEGMHQRVCGKINEILESL